MRILDLVTRPVGVPCYLLAARLSVALVRRRRNRLPANRILGNMEEVPTPFPEEVPAASLADGDCPPVSIVIPVLNGEQVIGRCLESIAALDYPAERRQVIVVDNGSTDRTVEIARRFGVQVLAESQRGPAAARNAGIAAAGSRYVATTDADCIVHPLWLKHLLAVYERGRLAAVGGRIVSLCRDPVIHEFCEREGVLNQRAAVEGRLLPFPFAISGNALFEREALKAVGGFDTDFPDAAAEDVDLGWRLIGQGCKIGYAPHALVAHRQRERGVDIHAQFRRYGRSEVWLYLKHRRLFGPAQLSKHLWIRPFLYRHFWEAVWRSMTARGSAQRRLWRLIVLKELGHMAGKMEANRRLAAWRHFRLWTYE